MLRTARPLLSSAPKLGFAGRALHPRPLSALRTPRPRIPQLKVLPNRATPQFLWTSYSTKPPLQPNKRDVEFEKEAAKKLLEARPDEVSTQSSVRHLVEENQGPSSKSPEDQDFLRGLKSDVHTVQETFALHSVPREPYVLGLAGTIPYLATSIATVYLSWDLNTTWPTSSHLLNSILISHETATHWLHLLEPIQVGYGALIVSFLGAIHWGLEFAEKSAVRERTRFRYGLGVIAPIVAWPTIFMPIEWALTTQFLGFTFLYFADTRAATRGWAPHWYGTYRWVLTAVVGVAIFISLVGRAKIGESRPRLTTDDLNDLLRQEADGSQPYRNWAKEEEEERERIKKEKEEQEKKKKEEEKKKKKKADEKKKGGKEKEKGEEKGEEKGNDKNEKAGGDKKSEEDRSKAEGREGQNEKKGEMETKKDKKE